MLPSQGTIVNLQALRFAAALWVAFLHSQFFINAQADVWTLPRIFKVLQTAGFAGVDIFFVISGAIMALTSRHLAPTLGNSVRFLLVRFARIYTGWWPLFALYWLGAATLGQTDGKSFVSSLLLLPVPLNQYVTVVLWTLSFELYFYCAVALLILLPKTWRVRFFAALLLALACATAIWHGQGHFTPAREAESWPWQGFVAFPLIGEFLAGFLLYEWYVRTRPTRALPWALGATVFFGLAVIYQKFVGKPTGASLDGFYGAPERALLLGGFAVCAVALALIARPIRGRLAVALVHLGDASYAIYLSHIMVFYALAQLLPVVGWPTRWYLPTLIVMLAAVTLFSRLYQRWIEGPLYRLCRHQIRQRLALV